MGNLKALLYDIKSELDKGHIVSIFLLDLISQKEMYADPMYIDYTKYGFDKNNILSVIKEFEKQKEIKIIDSGNMGWWITKYTEQ